MRVIWMWHWRPLVVVLATLMLLAVGLFNNDNDDSVQVVMSDATSMKYRLKGPLTYDDPALIDIVRQRFLFPPSTAPYSLHEEESQYGRYKTDMIFLLANKIVLHYFQNVTGGIFVEAGALDGQYLSNTLLLEKELGWTGLLVEPDSLMFQRLKEKNRKAWLAKTCLATKPYPHEAILGVATDPIGGSFGIKRRAQSALLESHTAKERLDNALAVYETVQCVPLGTLLLAANYTRVDYISLDVEDVESDVIDNFPFDRITVDVWYVEHRHPNADVYQNHKFDQEFVDKFKRQGYRYHMMGDYVFVRKGSKYDPIKVPGGFMLNVKNLPLNLANYRVAPQ